MFDYELAHDIINEQFGMEQLSEAKRSRKEFLRFALIGTVLAVGLSIGIQYLILRILGGAS